MILELVRCLIVSVVGLAGAFILLLAMIAVLIFRRLTR
jgi:hypothetical protein